MTTEQIAAVVGAVLLCLGNLAALIKVWTDNANVIKDRIATKLERDKDSTLTVLATQSIDSARMPSCLNV